MDTQVIPLSQHYIKINNLITDIDTVTSIMTEDQVSVETDFSILLGQLENVLDNIDARIDNKIIEILNNTTQRL